MRSCVLTLVLIGCNSVASAEEPAADRGDRETQTATDADAAAREPARGPISLSPQRVRSDRAGRQPNLPGASMPAVVGSLGIVLGLFLIFAWGLKRWAPQASRPLPGEAVEILGRTTLPGKHAVHLIRCGNKLLLVCLSNGAARTLTEITDPIEVDRLAGLCQSQHATSTTAGFRQLFQSLGKESPRGRTGTAGASPRLSAVSIEGVEDGDV